MKIRILIFAAFLAVFALLPIRFVDALVITTQLDDDRMGYLGQCASNCTNSVPVNDIVIELGQDWCLDQIGIGLQQHLISGSGDRFLRFTAFSATGTKSDLNVGGLDALDWQTLDTSEWYNFTSVEDVNYALGGANASSSLSGAYTLAELNWSSSVCFDDSQIVLLQPEIWDNEIAQGNGDIGQVVVYYATSLDIAPYYPFMIDGLTTSNIPYEWSYAGWIDGTISATISYTTPSFASSSAFAYSTSTISGYCDSLYSSSTNDFLNALTIAGCTVGMSLFAPSEASVNSIISSKNTLMTQFPFSVYTDFSTIMENASVKGSTSSTLLSLNFSGVIATSTSFGNFMPTSTLDITSSSTWNRYVPSSVTTLLNWIFTVSIWYGLLYSTYLLALNITRKKSE